MRPVTIEDGKLEIAVEWRCCNGLPHAFLIGHGAGAALIWINTGRGSRHSASSESESYAAVFGAASSGDWKITVPDVGSIQAM